MREIEIKLKARNLAALEHTLAEQGCVLSAPIHQHDVIYSEKRGYDTQMFQLKKNGQ